jgi:hypothetical protein
MRAPTMVEEARQWLSVYTRRSFIYSQTLIVQDGPSVSLFGVS